MRIALVCFVALTLLLKSTATELPKLPAEGRWSIALDWKNNWPAGWRHARETRTESVGDWRIHHGEIRLPQGVWKLRDAERLRPDGVLECRRRWEWTGDQSLDKVTLSIRRQVNGTDARPFLPGISYYNNPAGQSVDAGRIPVIAPQPGGRGFYEEHRFPLPLAAAEFQVGQESNVAALHSLPSPLAHGRHDDQWWSLGIEHRQDGVELALLSGATASNGQDDVIKAMQRSFLEYPDAWLTVTPGAIIEKRFHLQQTSVRKRGHGLHAPVWKSVELFDARDSGCFPSLNEVIRRKFHDTLTRWHEDDRFAGVDAFPDNRGRARPWIDLGWAGQSEAVAYPLLLLGQRFGITNATRLAQKAVDFIATAPFDRDGFAIRYDFKAHKWFDRRNPLSQAQAIYNLLNALRIAQETPGMKTDRLEAFLKRACELHARRILADDWQPKSTNEGFLIAPLADASSVLEEKSFLRAATKAADHYGRRHESMDEPYWGGTLDARCEDKEGAWAALQGFLAIYELTRDTRYLDWARHAADVIASYVYVWDVPLPPGRLADNAFKSRGWTAVSVQNMHLDVYGVLCAPALWRLGELTGRSDYRDLARLMVVSCGQLVDAQGGQGEQLHQTNYAQHYQVERLRGVRGDYVESWNVYWITAHFLTAAAQFEEMGVDWTSW